MPANVTPKPMPLTGLPDRVEPNQPNDMHDKDGIKPVDLGKMNINPGRPSGK